LPLPALFLTAAIRPVLTLQFGIPQGAEPQNVAPPPHVVPAPSRIPSIVNAGPLPSG
ncbi:hypothetical protein M9458_045657, partial [Cirrhinus mrigala]